MAKGCLTLVALTTLVGAVACTGSPIVRFTVDQPDKLEFNPLAGAVTEYALRTEDGTLLASANATGSRLDLGKLQTFPLAQDLQLQVLSGSDLAGMGRIRDVRVERNHSGTYETAVRKLLVLVGSTLPTEPGGSVDVDSGAILDATKSFDDLAHPTGGAAPVASLPKTTSSTATSWDGRFVFAGAANKISLFNTSTGNIDGQVAINFTPSHLVVAPRDVALAALQVTSDSVGAVMLYPDLSSVIDSPDSAQPITINFKNGAPRTAAFSADGQTLYVLLGSPIELNPCDAPVATPPPASMVASFALDGSQLDQWTLPGFAADMAIDPTGRHPGIVLSLSGKGDVIDLDPTSPDDAPVTTDLLRTTCPGAVKIVGTEVFVVTSAHPNDDVSSQLFLLERVGLEDKTNTSVSFQAPTYDVPLGATTVDGKVGFEQLFGANSIFGYELAVTPDGNRAVFATRAQYTQTNAKLQLFSNVDCFVTVNVAEYGLYLLDTRTGAALYSTRSQLIVGDPADCITQCEVTGIDGGPLFDLECETPTGVNDRAAGISALFGGG